MVMSEKDLPLLSVITPVYNGADFLEETLLSLVASDYPNIEFIVLDDGSKDDSAAIAERVLSASGRKYTLVRKENSGEADTDNQGLALAKGQFIAIVNCDDPIKSTLFTESIAVFMREPDVVVTYPDWEMIDERGNLLKQVEVKEYSLASLLGDLNCLPGPGAVIRRSAIKSPVLRQPEFRFTSDYRQWLTLSSQGRFSRIPKSLCTFRIHSAQQTSQAAGLTQAREMIACIDDFYQSGNVTLEALQLKKQAQSMALYLAAVQSLHRGGVPGRKYLVRSLFMGFKRLPGSDSNRRSIVLMILIAINPLGRTLSQIAIRRRQRIAIKNSAKNL